MLMVMLLSFLSAIIAPSSGKSHRTAWFVALSLYEHEIHDHSARGQQQFLKPFGGLHGFFRFLGQWFRRFVLRVNENSQVRNAHSDGLSAGRPLEIVVYKNHDRVSGSGQSYSVAHGAGSAGPSGADADQGVVRLSDQLVDFGFGR